MKRRISMLLVLALLALGCAAAEGRWTCPDCGQENEGNYCGNCGAARPDGGWICPDCGQENEGNFCGNCGAARPGKGARPERPEPSEPAPEAGDPGAPLSADSNQVQDFYAFAHDVMSMDSEHTTKDGGSSRSFSGGADGLDVVKRYVELLVSGGWNFTLEHVHEETIQDTFYSATLTYTGSAQTTGVLKETFDENHTGQLEVYCVDEGGRTHGRVRIVRGLRFEDLGLRRDGSVERLTSPGASLEATLVENPDGSFSTSDGRLSVGLGQAVVLQDGETLPGARATVSRNSGNDRYRLRVDRYSGDDCLVFTVPISGLDTGVVLDNKALNTRASYTWYVHSNDDLVEWAGSCDYCSLGFRHAGEYCFVHVDPDIGALEGRVKALLWDEDRRLVVLYIAASFDMAPHELECLAAFSLDDASFPGGSASQLRLEPGESTTLSFEHREYGASSEVYGWSVVEGGEHVALSGDNHQSCTLRALSEGVARVRVDYNYGTQEPNVLTGIMQTVVKTKTEYFQIEIIG